MLTAVIISNTIEGMQKEMQAADHYAEAYEWRVDALDIINIDELKTLRRLCAKPLIITLRSKEQGGLSELTGMERMLALIAFASLGPDYIDLESTDDEALVERVHASFPDMKIIRSFHDFEKTPDDLSSVLKSMTHPSVSLYKIIGYANQVSDSCRMIDFVGNSNNLVGHCMGPKGAFSRIMGTMHGNALTYAQMLNDEVAAPGIISLDEMVLYYRTPKLKADTDVYALLGNPVETSHGHIFHNNVFKEKNENCVYLKIPLESDELSAFVTWAKDRNFKGLSITMPHKEDILAVVDDVAEMAKKVGAVNTLKISDGLVRAINTDGAGALDALEQQEKVQGKSVLILGAGGAAKAIAYEADDRGAHVTIVNRTKSRAEELAKAIDCAWLNIEDLFTKNHNKFDMIINCLPQSAEDFLDRKKTINTVLNPGGLFMDITYGTGDDDLLKYADSKGFKTVAGLSMFHAQAELQQDYWRK